MSFNPKKQLSQFLAEDIGKGDITSALLTKKKISVKIFQEKKALLLAQNMQKKFLNLKDVKLKF